MSASDPDVVVVTHSTSQERYEATVGDVYVGYLDYVSEPEQVLITHTVIGDRFSGRGYAAQLVRYVLDDIASTGKKVVPLCSYVQHFVAENPEYADLTVPLSG
ncbi:GNAT family N-acetyltransferase [Williamsia sterculiae]|uniref:N-acetyltransferase domain-containing protein n=1 Tax=Williamsia sterculiae TaxID=1344003 RepID=A0A1N7CVV8_9NOCA|nr:GNAT family N-acetyltransferase [Williamsia sterculiae]SIR67607.1 hypothetical protein SAMN05445060_0391 [Williamsia sterculiae]